MNYSEDDCLQSNSKHCYKSLDSNSGLCYLGKEERTNYPSKDCVYHLPIVYESEQIVLSDEYVSRALSGPITTLNGSFPDNAFEYCESINCYMVVHEETTNSTYFMANPSQLSLQESGITFGPSDKRYTFYFEPRCEPMEPQARQTVVDLCRAFDAPSANAFFAIGYDQSDLAGPTDEDSCRIECEDSATCTSFAFRVDENECRFWNLSPDLPSRENPICII
ncbi:hypothetical protein TCAL_04575, partial [Tigriopus californicus]